MDRGAVRARAQPQPTEQPNDHVSGEVAHQDRPKSGQVRQNIS